VHYEHVVELHAPVTCVRILRVAQHCFRTKFMSPATVTYVVFMCSSKCRVETKECSFAHCLIYVYSSAEHHNDNLCKGCRIEDG
jgi:hypothetical protein